MIVEVSQSCFERYAISLIIWHLMDTDIHFHSYHILLHSDEDLIASHVCETQFIIIIILVACCTLCTLWRRPINPFMHQTVKALKLKAKTEEREA